MSPTTAITGKEEIKSSDVHSERFNALEEDVKEFITNSTTNLDIMDTAQLYGYLKAIDPITANRLHPNNKRKIMR